MFALATGSFIRVQPLAEMLSFIAAKCLETIVS